MAEEVWIDVGAADELARFERQRITAGTAALVLTCRDGRFGAVSARCNHIGGPLDEGTLDGDYLVCPWHYWAFHRERGTRRGDERHVVPAHAVRVEGGRVLVSAEPAAKRARPPFVPHPLMRAPERGDGPVRVLGISTTVMTPGQPRYSTSDDLLAHAIAHAAAELGSDTRLIHVRDLAFRHCEGFYSKAARACTWPCSITMMDPADQMDRIYEAVVHWADVILVSTPIRWGAASSLYYKMIERMNCIQNQETIANRHLLRHKVAAFIITGGQDNIQAVAGQMLAFFSEIGCQFPQFPFIAHSRGWSAEDMENNNAYVRESADLRGGAAALAGRSVAMARLMRSGELAAAPTARGGRKAHELDTRAQLPPQHRRG
jgi:nitrite reductase/ring-hydroxylating ferredoxin subunit/multimeric flavodoxin WrbA